MVGFLKKIQYVVRPHTAAAAAAAAASGECFGHFRRGTARKTIPIHSISTLSHSGSATLQK